MIITLAATVNLAAVAAAAARSSSLLSTRLLTVEAALDDTTDAADRRLDPHPTECRRLERRDKLLEFGHEHHELAAAAALVATVFRAEIFAIQDTGTIRSHLPCCCRCHQLPWPAGRTASQRRRRSPSAWPP